MYDEKNSDIEMTVFVFIRHKTAKFKISKSGNLS